MSEVDEFTDKLLRAAATSIYKTMTDEQWAVYGPFWHENRKAEYLAVARAALERAAEVARAERLRLEAAADANRGPQAWAAANLREAAIADDIERGIRALIPPEKEPT